jgi:hypothetical protein
LQRIIFTIRRTLHVVVASIAVELALDFGAGALAVILAPYLGTWVYAVAGVIVIGSLPVLGLNIARVARREWKRHRVMP